MAGTTKLPVEKVLEKIRGNDSSSSKSARRDEEMAALDEEIKRMRTQGYVWRLISGSKNDLADVHQSLAALLQRRSNSVGE